MTESNITDRKCSQEGAKTGNVNSADRKYTIEQTGKVLKVDREIRKTDGKKN